QLPIEGMTPSVEWTGEAGALLRYSTAPSPRGTVVFQEFSDGVARAEFFVGAGGRRIRARLAGTTSRELSQLVVGPVLGCAWRRRGLVCRHAGAVSVTGAAGAFVGSRGAGKPTTVAALLRLGHAAVTDDLAVLERSSAGSFAVHAGPPRLRLMPDAAAAL